MISDRHVARLSLTVTALVYLIGVYGLDRQSLGMVVIACAAGAATLGWGTLLRWWQRPRRAVESEGADAVTGPASLSPHAPPRGGSQV